MEKALYGPNGPKVTVAQFLVNEGCLLLPHLWQTQPLCPDCLTRVIPFGKSIALGFNLAGLDPEGAWPSVGFRHPVGEGEDCARRSVQKKEQLTPEEKKLLAASKKLVLGVLQSPPISAVNRAAFGYLGQLLLGRPLPPEELVAQEKHWQSKLSSLRVLATNPWLFPYDAALQMGGRMVQKGAFEHLVYKASPFDPLHLPFIDPFGEPREAIVPRQISLCLAKRGRSGRVYWQVLQGADGRPMSFSLTQEATQRLALRPKDFAPFPLPGVEKLAS